MRVASKKKWVRNLRSPKYADKQTRGALIFNAWDTHREVNILKFCALGVLINESPRTKVNKNKSWWVDKTSINDIRAITTAEIYRTVGLTADESQDVVRLNDIEGKTFAQIADYIEENF